MKSTYVQKKSEQSIDKRFIQDEFQGLNGCHLLNPKRAILYITKDKWIYLKLSLFCKMLWKGRSRKWIWIILKICKPITHSVARSNFKMTWVFFRIDLKLLSHLKSLYPRYYKQRNYKSKQVDFYSYCH